MTQKGKFKTNLVINAVLKLGTFLFLICLEFRYSYFEFFLPKKHEHKN